MEAAQLSQKDIGYIQGLIDYDNEIIAHGCLLCGKRCSPDNDYIARRYKATQKEINRVKIEAGVLPCWWTQ